MPQHTLLVGLAVSCSKSRISGNKV